MNQSLHWLLFYFIIKTQTLLLWCVMKTISKVFLNAFFSHFFKFYGNTNGFLTVSALALGLGDRWTVTNAILLCTSIYGRTQKAWSSLYYCMNTGFKRKHIFLISPLSTSVFHDLFDPEAPFCKLAPAIPHGNQWRT